MADEDEAPAGARAHKWQTRRVSPFDLHIGSRLRAARKERGLTLHQVAAAIGTSPGQAQKYERAENAIICSRLHDLARVLQVPPGWFFEGFAPDADLVFDGMTVSEGVDEASKADNSARLDASMVKINFM